jgi:hypothetical protein
MFTPDLLLFIVDFLIRFSQRICTVLICYMSASVTEKNLCIILLLGKSLQVAIIDCDLRYYYWTMVLVGTEYLRVHRNRPKM